MTNNNAIEIKVFFFASAREAAEGITEMTLELQSGADTAVLRYVKLLVAMSRPFV